MTLPTTVEFEVTYNGLTFDLQTTSPGSGPISVSNGSTIEVPNGLYLLRFKRSLLIQPLNWSFCGLGFAPPPNKSEAVFPFSSLMVADDQVEFVDANDNTSGSSISYQYWLRVLEASGESKWVDPVIENKSGM